MGRIHNLNRKVGRMGLLNLLYLTSMPTEHKNKYFVKCRYGKYFLCVSKGYKFCCIATFIVPKGAEYFENKYGHIVSSEIIYTGKYLRISNFSK